MIGLRIKHLRESKGLTQAELAKNMGINTNTLAGYERGIREPNIEKICHFSRFFGVTADYLLGLAEYKNDEWAEELIRNYNTVFGQFNAMDDERQTKFIGIFNRAMECYDFLRASKTIFVDYDSASVDKTMKELAELHIQTLEDIIESVRDLCFGCIEVIEKLSFKKIDTKEVLEILLEGHDRSSSSYHVATISLEQFTNAFKRLLNKKAHFVLTYRERDGISQAITAEEIAVLAHEKRRSERIKQQKEIAERVRSSASTKAEEMTDFNESGE